MSIDQDATPKDYKIIIYNKTEIDSQNAAEALRVDTELADKVSKQSLGSPSGTATLDPDGKTSQVEIPYASNQDIDNDVPNRIVSPEKLAYALEAGQYLTESIGDARYGNVKSDGSVTMDSNYLPQALTDITTVKYVQDLASSNTTTYIRDTLALMLAIPFVKIGDVCFINNDPDPSNEGEYLALVETTGGSTIDNWQKRNTDVAWGTIIDDIDNQTDLKNALNGKINNAQVLTDVPAGALFTDTIYNENPLVSRVSQNELDIAELQAGAVVFVNDLSTASGIISDTVDRVTALERNEEMVIATSQSLGDILSRAEIEEALNSFGIQTPLEASISFNLVGLDSKVYLVKYIKGVDWYAYEELTVV